MLFFSVSRGVINFRTIYLGPSVFITAIYLADMTHLMLFCALFLCIGFCIGDKIVYLDRPGHPYPNTTAFMTEPFFNPKTLEAEVGEQVHFVSRFNSFQSLPYTRVSTSSLLVLKFCLISPQDFVPYEWAFAESDFSTGCIYNEGTVPAFIPSIDLRNILWIFLYRPARYLERRHIHYHSN